MNKKLLTTKQMVTLGLLSAVILIMSTTTLGTLPLGPLSITLNMIPIAVAAITIGPVGGLITGLIFGLFSFLQAIGLFVPSGLGLLTFAISPFMTFIQRVISRALVGLILGYLFCAFRKLFGKIPAFFVTGGLAALLNFVFFMGLLVLLFGQNADVANMWADETVMAYLGVTFLSNTIFEVIATTILTGLICLGLYKARLLDDIK